MKKILFTIALALLTGSVMAQTPEEKAAAKAAKAALKEATKQANKQLNDGLACATQVQTMYQTIQMEKQKGQNSNDRLIIENEMKIQTVSQEGISLLTQALSTEYIKDNKKYQAYKALDEMSTMVLNNELVKASKKEPYDRAALSAAIFAVSEACHGELTYANPNDQMQAAVVESVKMKFPKMHAYFAYLCQFCIEAKDMEGAQKA